MRKIKGAPMTDDLDERIAENVRFAFVIAEKILQSAGEDGHDAFLKAVGTLAQVLYVTSADEHREELIKQAAEALRNYLKLLDELSRQGSIIVSRQH
jgi:hypothetical protein